MIMRIETIVTFAPQPRDQDPQLLDEHCWKCRSSLAGTWTQLNYRKEKTSYHGNYEYLSLRILMKANISRKKSGFWYPENTWNTPKKRPNCTYPSKSLNVLFFVWTWIEYCGFEIDFILSPIQKHSAYYLYIIIASLLIRALSTPPSTDNRATFQYILTSWYGQH